MPEKPPQPKPQKPELTISSDGVTVEQFKEYAKACVAWLEANPDIKKRTKNFQVRLDELLDQDHISETEAKGLLTFLESKRERRQRTLVTNAEDLADRQEQYRKSDSEWAEEEQDAYEHGANQINTEATSEETDSIDETSTTTTTEQAPSSDVRTEDGSEVISSKEQQRAEKLAGQLQALKSMVNELRKESGLTLMEMQKRSRNFSGFYGKVRALGNRAEKLQRGETVPEAEINDLRKEALDFLRAFRAEVHSDSDNTSDGDVTPPGPEPAPSPDGEKQWEKRAELKKALRAKQAEYDALFQQKSHKWAGKWLGLNPRGFAKTKAELNEAKAADAAAAMELVQKRAEQQNKAEVEKGLKAQAFDKTIDKKVIAERLELIDQKYLPYVLQRYVVDDARRRVEAQGELLSEDKKRMVKELGAKLKKYKWPLRVGSVALAGGVAAVGAATAGVGLAAAAGVGAVAGGTRGARMATGIGGAMLGGSLTYKYLDKRVGVKKDALIESEARVRQTAFDDTLHRLDELTETYQSDYQALGSARKLRNRASAGAAVVTGVAAGASMDQMVDTIDQMEFLLTDYDPTILNSIDATIGGSVSEPAIPTDTAPTVAEVVDAVPDQTSPSVIETPDLPEEGAPEIADVPPIAEPSEPLVEVPAIEDESPEVSDELTGFGGEGMADPVPPEADALNVETTTPEAQPATPDVSELEEPTVPNEKAAVEMTDLETLLHTTETGDWISAKLIDFYPQYFEGLTTAEWNQFIDYVNNRPDVLEAAGVTSGDLGEIYPGDEIRYDILAEAYINDITGEGLQPVMAPADATPYVSASEPTEGYAESDIGEPERITNDEVSEAVNAEPTEGYAESDIGEPERIEADGVTEQSEAAPAEPDPEEARAQVEAKIEPGSYPEPVVEEWKDRITANMDMEDQNELLERIAGREQFVADANDKLEIGPDTGLNTLYTVPVEELQRSIAEGTLTNLMAEYGVADRGSLAELLQSMSDARLLQGDTFKDALEAAIANKHLDFTTNGTGEDLFEVSKVSFFGSTKYPVLINKNGIYV